jgi:hypothetical protein
MTARTKLQAAESAGTGVGAGAFEGGSTGGTMLSIQALRPETRVA